MPTPTLGSIELCDLRDVWKDEARDFTPWLFENSEQLAKVLGFELELHATEHKVGRFSLDIIGSIPESNEIVIIENQLESGNHTHFGQLLTYAGGTKANYVIWIAKEFKEEYLSAIEWLNDGTTNEINFFAVEISAVKIGNSLPAPMFKVVAQPNGWQKEGRAAAAVALSGGMGSKRLQFWENALEAISKVHPEWVKTRKPRAQSWYSISSGVSNISYNFVVTRKEMKVDLYFWANDRETNIARFEALKSHKSAIESKFGAELQWHFPDDNKQGAVRFCAPAEFEDESTWAGTYEWFIQNMSKLRLTMDSYLKEIKDI
jgi:hypothetical protein